MLYVNLIIHRTFMIVSLGLIQNIYIPAGSLWCGRQHNQWSRFYGRNDHCHYDVSFDSFDLIKVNNSRHRKWTLSISCAQRAIHDISAYAFIWKKQCLGRTIYMCVCRKQMTPIAAIIVTSAGETLLDVRFK